MMNRFLLLLNLIATMALSACNTKRQPCLESSAQNLSNGHLAPIELLETYAPEFLDSLNAHPQLQVYRVMQQADLLRMDCYVYQDELRLFFASYNLLKNTRTGAVAVVGANKLSYPIAINLQPTVAWLDAVVAARTYLDFGTSCQTHTLGVMEESPGAYYLVWMVAAEDNPARFVMLDAHTNEVRRLNPDLWE